ncbi:MAG: Holliday junction resolvase RuvX [Bacteroidetes bacterium]|nr:Holliday junction resolvase RuvX [Bacteroidota bacterium]
MSRILAIDYGTKRVGLAVTDTNRIIASGLDTVHAKDVISFLKKYASQEEVACFVVGEPKQMDASDSQVKNEIDRFIRALKKTFPDIPVERFDERFTSKMASQALLMSGASKKDRRNKELVDMTSAIIILQSYMESKK